MLDFKFLWNARLARPNVVFGWRPDVFIGHSRQYMPKRVRRAAKKQRSAHKNCAKIWVVLKYSQVPMEKESSFPKLRSRAISQNREKIMKKFHFFDFQDICGFPSRYSSITFFLRCDHRFHKITTTNKFRLHFKLEPKEKIIFVVLVLLLIILQ